MWKKVVSYNTVAPNQTEDESLLRDDAYFRYLQLDTVRKV